MLEGGKGRQKGRGHPVMSGPRPRLYESCQSEEIAVGERPPMEAERFAFLLFFGSAGRCD